MESSNSNTQTPRRLKSTVALQIVQAATRKDVALPKLAKLAQADPAFALRVLAMVNSPSFALAQRVGDLQQAVPLLGIRGMRNLALSLALSDMTPLGKEGSLLLANSIRRATAAKLLAQFLGEPEPDSHFTTGLFLESGLLIRAADDLPGAAAIAQQPALFRTKLERADGWQDHPALGAELARDFRLPDDTVKAIRYHHSAEPGKSIMQQVAWAAERVAAVFEGGDMKASHQRAVRACVRIGAKEQDAHSLLSDLPGLIERSAHGFQRKVPRQQELADIMADATKGLVELNNQYASLVLQLEQTAKERTELTEKLQRANKMLSELAFSDALTGLANKRAFTNALKREISRSKRSALPVSLMMMDVDHFRQFNEAYGHPVGDEVLRRVGSVIRESVRESDFAARYGGEEFVVILPETEANAAMVVAERVRSSLEASRVNTEHGALGVTTSIGVATSTANEPLKSAALISAADGALYKAKRAGRNRVHLSGASED